MAYADLKTDIIQWSARSDIDPYVPSFITQATALFNDGWQGIPALRMREMEEVVEIPITTGYYTLPTDYLQHKNVVDLGAERRRLEFIVQSVADQQYPSRAVGVPNDFTIIGSKLYTFPISANDIELTYYKKIPDLSTTAETNWLLTRAPHLYLHASLIFAGYFVRDDQMISRHTNLLTLFLSAFREAAFSSDYARAGVRPQGIRP